LADNPQCETRMCGSYALHGPISRRRGTVPGWLSARVVRRATGSHLRRRTAPQRRALRSELQPSWPVTWKTPRSSLKRWDENGVSIKLVSFEKRYAPDRQGPKFVWPFDRTLNSS